MERSEKPLNTYRNFVMDSTRWEKFKARDGDILVCTPSKCGTTWTQMICALLVFQKTSFGKPLSDISPWLDLMAAPVDEVMAQYESQTHRRFIKTHTPFDGLPYYKNTTYLCVGRDPRDAFLSLQSHFRNINPEFIGRMMKNMPAGAAPPARPQQQSLLDSFRAWITAPGTAGANTQAGPAPDPAMVLNHVKSFWQYRHLPNIHFVHYSDLQRDLESEMRRIAKILGIGVPEKLWPEFVKAAQFENMKADAAMYAPDVSLGAWREVGNFFNKGVSGQWREVFGPEELAVYAEAMGKLPPGMAQWLENGRGATG